MRYAIVLAVVAVLGLLLFETERRQRAERIAPASTDTPEPRPVPASPAAAGPAPGAAAEDAPGARGAPRPEETEPGVIAGVVLDPDGETPVDAMVILYGRDGPMHMSRTDPETGRFRFRDLSAERYSVGLRVRLEAALGRPPEGLLTAYAGTTGLRIVLEPRSWITFRIIDAATRAPIEANRSVSEVRVDGEVRRCSASGPGTGFPMRWHWPPGTPLRLHATAVGYVPSDVVELDLGAEPEQREVVFRLAPDPGSLATLTLDVRDDTGAPVRSLCIWRESGGGQSGEDREADDGRYVIGGIPAGKRFFRVGAPFHARTLQTAWLDQELDVQLGRGERAARTVTLRRGGWLRRPTHQGRSPPVLVRIGETECVPTFHHVRGGGSLALVPAGRCEVVAPLWGDETTLGESALRGEVEIVPGEVHEVRLEAVR